ncbi:MAG: glycosyltransferase [Desmonostoc vinosum HA7617-LM4]|nr:glycosyltransferase [Desmonostoc vinosum HA7617-LM4]
MHYLESLGYKSCIYSLSDVIQFQDKSDVIIFVKSFQSSDLQLAKQAQKAGIPIILDLCDNILIEEYTTPKMDISPAEIFKEMSKIASAIVTTGMALKNVIEAEIGNSIPIFIIPDGNETLEDVQRAITFIKWQRWLKLAAYRPTSVLLYIKFLLHAKFNALSKKSNVWQKKYLAIHHWRKKISKVRAKFSRLVKYLLRIDVNDDVTVINQTELDNAHLPVAVFVANQEKNQQLISKSHSILEHSGLSQNLVVPENSKRIIWFGHHGARYGNFGMLNILDIAEHLIKLSQEINFTLFVVSNSYEKYCQHILPLPFPTQYINWNPFQIYEYIAQSDVTIVPNSKTPFSICKSANRTVMSLSLGVPVVATKTPALEVLQDCIICDDWEEGLRSYLSDRQLVNSHIETAQSIIKHNYSGEAIAAQWANVINQVTRNVV